MMWRFVGALADLAVEANGGFWFAIGFASTSMALAVATSPSANKFDALIELDDDYSEPPQPMTNEPRLAKKTTAIRRKPLRDVPIHL